ncbi:uncharacterized protein [Nicotiana sylvestris]|uniref:uncharacterized protein n=1 Tax=Nicotiana sylvestris TaxID=4096 RepID=UPI00388CCA1A
MAPKDEELTTFRTPKGIYCYKVMPFGLKNVGATYQRAMQNIFDDLLHKNVECYVDDLERSVGALLAQENSEGKENSLYYLSRMMTPNELNYSPIEKLCLALVFSIQKLKHYFQVHVVRLISKANPIKFVMSKPVLNHPIPDDWELTDELPDEDAMVIEVQSPWKMYFDGVAHRGGAGAGVVFITPQGEVLPNSFILTQLYSNNVVEYQALILGLEMAVDIKQLQLQVFGDSQLVVNQLLGSYEVKKPELCPYHDYAKKLMGWLGDMTIQHVPRKENKKPDALAALASSLALPDQAKSEEKDCRRRAPRFLYYKDTLYRRSFKGVLLRFLREEEALQALQEAHSGGLDVVGPLPKSYGGNLYILAATDYFSKWAEVVAIKESFDNRLMNKICDLFGFKQRNSSMYNVAANGLAEAFNKTLCNLLEKVISKSKRDWNDCMEEAIRAYRTVTTQTGGP